MQRRSMVYLLTGGCLTLATSGCIWPDAPVEEYSACQVGLSSGMGGFSIDSDESLRNSLERCKSQDEWVREAVYLLPEPYAGDEVEVRQLLEDLCEDRGLSETRTCKN